ncbi:MAG TPA: serine hydrolase domain-containing protein [Vicinamibacterales bacterium]|nr:serine hydrolase domain-containing protein [Vicinamibacterales bacterium]
MRSLAATLLSALVLSFAATGAQNSPDALIATIEGPQTGRKGELTALTLEAAMQNLGVPGASIAVIEDFEIHWSRGYGVADTASGARVAPDTLFQAASISKPVAAMAMLKAVQDGRFTLDQDINTILTSWKVPAGDAPARPPVTLRSLLSHTSGSDDGFGFPGYKPGAPVPTLVQILNGEKPSNVGPVLFARPPFAAFKYSGGGVTLVQLLMSDVTKRPFEDVMRDLVLNPIGMTHSAYEQPLSPARDRNAARGHDRTGAASDVKWHVYPELAAAGLWTTSPDLARFGIELQKSLQGQSNRVLNRAMANEMASPVGVGPFAIGMQMTKAGEGWYLNHGGSNWGFQCLLFVHKVKGYGFAAMTNSDSGGRLLGELQQRIAAAYKWDSLDQPLRR